MKIITLTLNPAFDIHCHVNHFAPCHENLARITDNEAGGKGINISRALTENGIENLAFVVLGDENSDSFRKKLDADQLTYRYVTVDGRIRENITVHTDGADETRISFEGFQTDAALLDTTLEALEREVVCGTYVTFTGRVPSGIEMESVKIFLRELAEKGARIIIDSRSFSLDDLIEMKPWLIKPNQEEISEYLNRTIERFEDALGAAKELHGKGIEHVMISLGSRGALLVCGNGAYVASPPRIDAVSTIGAGDSSIGGFLAAAVKGEGPDGMLRRAVAYGTAACMTKGTRPPRREDVNTVLELINIQPLD